MKRGGGITEIETQAPPTNKICFIISHSIDIYNKWNVLSSQNCIGFVQIKLTDHKHLS